MTLTISRGLTNDPLTLFLKGRLDIGASGLLEAEASSLNVEHLVLDFADCNYVSSSGLRVLLLTHQRQAAKGGSLLLRNLPPNVREVLDVTGLSDLLNVSAKPREISLDDAELISHGAFGECYRLDVETVVKLYREGVDSGVAEKEKKFAKAAFVLGVPTAISFDLVTCRNRTGIVYEMLDAEMFSSVIRRSPEEIPRHARRLSDIAKGIHRTVDHEKIFPDIRESFRDYIDQMGFFFDQDDIGLLRRKLDAIPQANSCVHFDLHTSNIMLKEGKPFIIDMGDFSRGSYFFDMGLMATIYGIPEFNVCEKVTGLTQAQGLELCDRFMQEYFSDKGREEYRFYADNKDFLASLRAIYTITVLPRMRDELALVLKDHLMPRIRREG